MNSFKSLPHSGNAALCLQQKSREAKHFENVSLVLILKFAVLRAESRLLRRAGLQSLCGSSGMFVGRGFSHDINASD